MSIEKNLGGLFDLRAEQNELNKTFGDRAEKPMNNLNKKAERLLSLKKKDGSENKAGAERLGDIMTEAQKENVFRDQIISLTNRLKLDITMKPPSEFAEQMEGDRRYIALKTFMLKGDKLIDVFFKALKPNYKIEEFERDQSAFMREMETMAFLKEHTDLPILKIESNNLNADEGLYNLTETLPDAEIGFIHSKEDMLKLRPEHAQQAVEQMFKLYGVKLPDDIDEQIHDIQDPFEHFEGYKENLWNLLDNKENADCTEVRALDSAVNEEGEVVPEIYADVLARRFEMSGEKFRQKITDLLARWQPIVEKYDDGDWVLTHGDLSPSNMYIGKDDKAQFLDWEWAGKTKNQVLAMVYDYGNLRARAWNNPNFQEALDIGIKAKFAELGDSEAGRAAVSLGILRSHALLAGFFENYEPVKQLELSEIERREKTEEAICLAFTEAGIEFGEFSPINKE